MSNRADEARVKAALPLERLLGKDQTKQFLRQASLARIPTGRDVMAEGVPRFALQVEVIPLVRHSAWLCSSRTARRRAAQYIPAFCSSPPDTPALPDRLPP